MTRLKSLLAVFVLVLSTVSLLAQERKGTIIGSVTDTAHAVLPGARITLNPGSSTAASDGQGRFTITGVRPGRYDVTVSYLGFEPFTTSVEVTSGGLTNVEAELGVAQRTEQVTVKAERQFGELEALNVERTSPNIVQVLPAEVITSLPNTNIADAVGRLPSVSLERDEGEGKYIQIRGTEPRLSNVTIDGIHMPSPENVRNVKLDVVPAELVGLIEVNKTLSANQDADAIGGSVNLVTKTPGSQPYYSLLAMGGYNPIVGGRWSRQLAATGGQRFGEQKRFGILLGGSYDFNSRGINDVEPAPTANQLPDGSFFFGPNTEDIRQYAYNRTRFGFAGGLDYKIGKMSSVYLRGLFSRFNDYGEDWIYSPGINNFIQSTADPNNTCGIAAVTQLEGCGGVGFTNVFRVPTQQIWGVHAGGTHVMNTWVVSSEVALSQAKFAGGYPRASFDGPGAADSSVAFGVNVNNPFTPIFPVLNGVNIYDPTQYTLTRLSFGKTDTFERDIVGSLAVDKNYHAGSHYGVFEVGFKAWDARKSEIENDLEFSPNGTLTMDAFVQPFNNSNYYYGVYPAGPVTRFKSILSMFQANPGAFTGGFDPVRSLPNDFDISERIWAGYVMNTITLGRFKVNTGLRVESTKDDLLGNVVTLDSTGSFQSSSPLNANNSYTNVFPSVQVQYRINDNTDIRAGYGMGIARPNFGDMAPFVQFDPTSSIPVSAGNPDLKPTHAQNFDVVIERYLKPVGLLQFGGFYKYLTYPIFFVNSVRTVQPFAGQEQIAPINGPSAHVGGIEASWEQQLRFLPSVLRYTGVRANYSWTGSQATFPVGFGRTDKPALIRQAPNNWNFDFTFDHWGLSSRMGLTHNDADIWSYGFQDGATGGIKGPLGDTYLFPHTQVDAQVSYLLPHSHGVHVLASFLNLNDEVFGFYNGSERFPIQREYYRPTFSFGIRWDSSRER